MADNLPGQTAIQETEEKQIWVAGPDNNHKRYEMKIHIKSTVTDPTNTVSSTDIRAGNVVALKDADGFAYLYNASANDGSQSPVGILDHMVNMLRLGVATDKTTQLMTAGIIRNLADDIIGYDKMAMATLLRNGFSIAQLTPHGSGYLLHPWRRDFKDGTALAGAYTITDADHGKMLVAITAAMNFTLPSLATVGPGFEVLLYNNVNANMVVTAAADTIIYDDTTNGKATTLTFSTGSQKMGASVLMRSDYDGPAGTLSWYPLMIQRTVVAA